VRFRLLPLDGADTTTSGLRCHTALVAADEVLATAAAARLGLIRSDAWPMVAAQLLASGHDGSDLLAVACMGKDSSGWQIDQLVPGALSDLGAPDLSIESAGEIIGRLIAEVAPPNSNSPWSGSLPGSAQTWTTQAG